LSASAFEALRACPYRFFARSVLRLGEAEELDEDIEKRDYGNWLHKVLHAFHLERSDAAGAGAARDVEGETTRLRAIGDAKLAEEGIDPAAFLPFGASFSVFAPRYVAWLHERERAGWSWLAGEAEFVATPQELEGVELYGRIDRIDRHPGPAGAGQPVLELIDYKTGSASRLKESMLESFEDTQLAFYAALVRSTRDEPLQASYLALDGTRGIEPIAHREVETSAAALIVGAAGELARIRAGEALPPLGEGTACDYCEARGLCRRDHWTSEVEPAEPPEDER
jgi:ATP-dependent helicase/nuclease subunit B